jgi:RNA polymerase sigma-70 factor (ECF subfamily)
VSETVPPSVATLYVQYGASVLRRARQILRRTEAAEEILQEVFARLVAQPALLREVSAPSTFLYVATTNACLNRLRDQRNRERLIDRQVRPSQDALAPGSSADRAVVLDLLDRLPADQASAFIYCYLDGMSHAEIADVLGCSRRHVGNLIDRAQTRARQLAGEAR